MNKNKNFRKSAIVIPALALMVLTAGASATGAVAWFTANRAVSASAKSFTAYDPNGALTITAAAGQGTSLESGSNVNILTQNGSGVKSVLRDASYDNVNQKLYRAVMEDTSDASSSSTSSSTSSATNPTPHSYAEVENNNYDTGSVVAVTTGQATQNSKVFWALSWDYTFGYNSKNANGTALFFDLSSTFSNTDTSAKGFRIAFHATAGNHYTATSGSTEATTTKVEGAALSYFTWTNNTDKANDNTEVNPATPTTYKENQYVGGTATTEAQTNTINPTTYAAYKLVSTTSGNRIEDAAKSSSELATTAGWLGTFTSGNNGVNQIKVHVVAWYEGTDDNVISANANSNEAITASMKFYARDIKASNTSSGNSSTTSDSTSSSGN